MLPHTIDPFLFLSCIIRECLEARRCGSPSDEEWFIV
jgi:hypothetical protein